jgi:hypothetical protein
LSVVRKSGANPGDVVRYVPASEPFVAALAIAALTFVEIVFAALFIFLLVTSGSGMKGSHLVVGPWTFVYEGNSVAVQQAEAFTLGSALLTLGAILSLYRKFFLPDVMLVKKRKLKYEDLM